MKQDQVMPEQKADGTWLSRSVADPVDPPCQARGIWPAVPRRRDNWSSTRTGGGW